VGFERITLFGIIELELESTGTGTLTLSTDLPGSAMAVRETKSVTATSRRPVRFRLQGTTKGHLYSVKLVPPVGGVIRLYGGRIWARVLPGAQWDWYAIPMIATPEEWTPQALPIPPTPQEWTPQPLPIPPTPQEWTPQPLPIKPTPQNPEWVQIPVDQ
jgi:hypothetical protein